MCRIPIVLLEVLVTIWYFVFGISHCSSLIIYNRITLLIWLGKMMGNPVDESAIVRGSDVF